MPARAAERAERPSASPHNSTRGAPPHALPVQAQRQAYESLKADRHAYWGQVKTLAKAYKPGTTWSMEG